MSIVLYENSAIFSHFSVGSGIRTKFFQFLNFGELYLDFLQIKFLIWTTDGSWSDWASFEGCSLSCDGGLLTRSRLCISPPAMNGGNECVGPALETVDCNTQPCPTGKLALIVVLFSRRRWMAKSSNKHGHIQCDQIGIIWKVLVTNMHFNQLFCKFWGHLWRNVAIQAKTAVATFWVTLGKMGYCHANWSHWSSSSLGVSIVLALHNRNSFPLGLIWTLISPSTKDYHV